MARTVIRLENISKQYRLGNINTGSFSSDLQRWWYTICGKEDPFLKIGEENDTTKKGSIDYVWALRDITFDIKQGDILGIVGRNGAGKSTLLKILSRTTLPTTGSFKIKSRIASLLEVGTGFHPELTGRENIFLNGAILGMTKAHIKKKFDEIVDFSGVEKYIDTPVKRYSSGMYVRLAFAIAAHLESEILIVDEVLAVGDAEFQKKCLGKMSTISKGEGRTVLFVSHNMTSIQALCNKCIYLKNGLLLEEPDITEVVIQKYLRHLNVNSLNIPISTRTDRKGRGSLKINDLKILDKDDYEVISLISGQRAIFSVYYENMNNDLDDMPIEVSISFNKMGGGLVTIISSKYINFEIKNSKKAHIANFHIDRLPLMSGTYTLNVMVRKKEVIEDWIQEAQVFDVENGDYYKTGVSIPDSHNSIFIDYSFTQ